MAVTRFTPLPGNYGEEYISPSIWISSSGNILATTAITRVALPTTGDRLWFKGARVVMATWPTGTVGATMYVAKRTVGGTFIQISTAVSILGLTAFSEVVMTPIGGIAEGSYCLQPGESFMLVTDNTGGTVTGAGSNVAIAAKLAVLR